PEEHSATAAPRWRSRRSRRPMSGAGRGRRDAGGRGRAAAGPRGAVPGRLPGRCHRGFLCRGVERPAGGGAARDRPDPAHRGRARGARLPRPRGGRRAGGRRRELAARPPERHRPLGDARRRGRADVAAGDPGARGSRRGNRDRQALRLRGVGALRQRRPRPSGAGPEAGGALMLHAVVSDIHGNLEALETVLADLDRRRVAGVACLGDFVGYGAAPNECIERLRPRVEVAVAGNHDLAACGRIKLGYFHQDAATAARWTDTRLTPENRAYLEGLPFAVEWLGMWLVHSSPANPRAWSYVLSPLDAEAEMRAYPTDICLIGHSHYPGT